jgi:hypothetical protein
MKSPAISNICWHGRTRLEAYCIEFSSESVFRLSNLSKTNSVARMTINPGIPIPSAMPRVSALERPFNGADDAELDKVDAGVAEDDPDGS